MAINIYLFIGFELMAFGQCSPCHFAAEDNSHPKFVPLLSQLYAENVAGGIGHASIDVSEIFDRR